MGNELKNLTISDLQNIVSKNISPLWEITRNKNTVKLRLEMNLDIGISKMSVDIIMISAEEVFVGVSCSYLNFHYANMKSFHGYEELLKYISQIGKLDEETVYQVDKKLDDCYYEHFEEMLG